MEEEEEEPMMLSNQRSLTIDTPDVKMDKFGDSRTLDGETLPLLLLSGLNLPFLFGTTKLELSHQKIKLLGSSAVEKNFNDCWFMLAFFKAVLKPNLHFIEDFVGSCGIDA